MRRGLVRSVGALAGAALLALVVGLALPAPARAQSCTLNSADLWCGVVTVGRLQVIGTTFGYGFQAADGTGALSDSGFSVETNPYTIDAVFVGTGADRGGKLYFSLTGALTATDTAKLELHIDGSTSSLAFSAATLSGTIFNYVWERTGLDWSSTSSVTLRLQDATVMSNTAPVFADATATREVPENSAADTAVGAVVTADDADTGDTLDYTLGGTDASSFDIDSGTGQIKTVSSGTYNYEAAQNTYSVTVTASDGTDNDSIVVTINLTDVDEQPDKPDKPTVTAVSGSSTSLDVSWTKPGLNGGPEIIGYELRYDSRASPTDSWSAAVDWPHTGTTTTTTITGLTANTEHRVQVAALNDEIPSAYSSSSDVVSTNAETPTAPTITEVAVTSTPQATSDTYGPGETIDVSVTFSEAVTATTGTDFVLSVAGRKRAPLSSGSGTTTLVFGYTVQTGDSDDNGIWIGDQDRTLVGNRTGNPQNGTITSVDTGTAADLTHAALGQQSDHKVDGSLSGPEPVDPVEPPEVTLHLSDADGEVGEDAGAVTVTATVSPASATAFAVTVSASPVAPATDDDFELSTNRALSFAANATASSGTVTIAPVDDSDAESNQVVTVSGSASIEGVTDPGDVTLTILDNDLVSIDGICNRTPRVRDRILVLLKNRHSFQGRCGDVNETHLAQLVSLDLGRNPSTESAVTMSLRSNDFEGLVNLERLYLRETGLRSLPAGVFSGLAALETLELDNDQLRSLPAGVFSDLHSLKTLELHRNPSLSSLPYDEFEALPNLTKLLVDPEGRRGYQMAGGEGDVTLEVAAGGRTTYQVRLTHTPAYVTSPQPTLTVSSDTAGVIATPATLRFTKENWFRRQTVTVYAPASTAGATATLSHTSVAVTYDRPIPTVTVRVLESAPGRTAEPLTAAFEGLPSSHDGETAFSFRIAFSEAVAVTPEAMRTRVLEVAGGAVTGAARVDGASGLWSITVTPATREELSITLARSADCEADGAVCTSDGRALSSGAVAIVIGPAERNTAARGTPAIGGTAQVGEELTASTSGISDADGLDNASFGYQWIRTDTDIQGATGSTYTAVDADEGKRLKVRVGFTDDAGNGESLTSAATDAVAARPEPLTAGFEGMPAEHAGKGSFSFRVAFSDGINISYKTVRDASFRVTGGDVTAARRVDKRRDLWKITIEPDSHEAVSVRLPETTDCDASGAICTSDGRPLSHSLSATVAGPVGIAVADARVDEGDGVALAFAVTLSRAASAALTVDYATADGSAHAGDDYTAASGTLSFAAGERSKTIETFSDSIKDDYFEAIQPDGRAVPEQYAETRQSVYICRAWSVGAPAPQRAPSRTNPHVVAYCRTHLGKPF